MPDLSPKLEELVQAGRNASRPTGEDFERVLESLSAKLGEAIAGGGSLSTSSATRVFAMKAIGITVATVAFIIGGGAWIASRNREVSPSWASTVTQAAASVSSRVPSSLGAAPVSDESTATDATISPSPSQPKPGPASSVVGRVNGRSRDSLSEEVTILSRAGAELHGGRAESALRLLNEHERRFPNGILTEERTAARVQALCALGRNIDAQAQLSRLSPKSLHGARARRACGLEPSDPSRRATGQ